MKKLAFLLACVAIVQFAVVESSTAHPRFHREVTFAVFYDGLSPYGEWISIGGGVYGWRPLHVVVGWRPYTIGRWVWTDYGWYWLSDEPWGWAVYHYGRWYYDDFYGWIWIPGYDWGPAWVEWRYGGHYIGWAPLGPYAIFSIHWGIHYRTRWYTPVYWWNFVHCRYISSPSLHLYIDRPESNTRYIGMTRTGGSVRYSGGRIVSRGPEREFVERQGNVRLEPVRIREIADAPVERVVREGNREQIEVYRPVIQDRVDDEEAAIRPSRVREESGRTLDLDTRKIDVRARASSRTDVQEMQRSDNLRVRTESGRLPGRSDEGMLKGPVDNATRDRAGREKDDRVRSFFDRQGDGTPPEPPAKRDDESVRGLPDRAPERVPPPRRDSRERKREESFGVPQREELGLPEPRRSPRQSTTVPQHRPEKPPHDTAPQRGGESRNPGGRDRGR